MDEDYIRALDEYKEAGDNWRHCAEVRLKQIVIYLSASTVVAAAALTDKITSDDTIKTALSIVGIAVTVVFAVLDERVSYYRRAYLRRLEELEEKLGFWQYRLTDNIYWRPLRSEIVYGFFFIFIIGAWLFYLESMNVAGDYFFIVWIAFTLVALGARHCSSYLQYMASDLDDRRNSYADKIADEKRRKESGFKRTKQLIKWLNKIGPKQR